MKMQTRQSGSILIEALISLVVLAIGIIAIAKLEGLVMRSGSDAQARNVALKLAQQKVDDLRAYNQILANGMVWSDTVTNPTTRPFEFIGDLQGGRVLWPATVNNSGQVWKRTTVGNTNFDVRWLVDNYDDSGVVGTASIDKTDYKKVTMIVSWTDIDGDIEQIRLASYIAKIETYGSKLLATGGADVPGPSVIYNPGVAPEVISIDSQGESIETTLPEPAIKKLASTNYFFSQFETVTYGVGNVELRREEFLNINCQCQYATGNNWKNDGYPVAKIIWHPDHEDDAAEHAAMVAGYFHPDPEAHAFIFQTESSRADFLGDMITKVAGIQATSGPNQHPFCTICCRDHHDGKASYLATVDGPDTGSVADNTVDEVRLYACDPTDDDTSDNDGQRANCFDPWRPVADYDSTTGDHKHYTSAGAVVNPGANGTYIESCRLKRINGLFKVFQDWHLHANTFAAAADETFTSPNKLDDYRAFIKDYIKTVIVNSNNLPLNYTTTTILNPATSFFWPPVGTTYPATSRFISRGIYMDYLDTFSLSKINELVNTTTFFENVPFNEINLTRLTRWQNVPFAWQDNHDVSVGSGECEDGTNGAKDYDASDDDTFDCVTNYDLTDVGSTGNPEDIDRGEVRVKDASSRFEVKASIRLGNTAFTKTEDPLDEPTTSANVNYPATGNRTYDSAQITYTTSVPGNNGTLN
ncbi:MAG: type IV pilus modification PilV family protein [Gammaproteobacteria bacterium]